MTLGDYQNEIYFRGLAGELPATPVGAAQLEAAAQQVLTPQAWCYVAGSAGTESTARANRAAFERWRLVPRMLRGMTQRRLTTTLLGTEFPAPVLLAPVGVLGIVHPDAELAVARAAAATGVGMVLSTAASTPMEQVAAELGAAAGWYQLYWPRDREVAVSLVRRAERAGYRALVVTVDTWVLGWRPRDLTGAYLPFLVGEGLANYTSDPVFAASLGPEPTAAIVRFVQIFGNPELTWEDLAWLRGCTDLPIVVKGVQHPDDVGLAIDAGVDAVICSNHGGRQVDGRSPRWTPCLRWWGRPPGGYRCSSTPGCAAVPTWSRRWRWGPQPCCWDAPTSTGWLSTGRGGCATWYGRCLPSST